MIDQRNRTSPNDAHKSQRPQAAAHRPPQNTWPYIHHKALPRVDLEEHLDVLWIGGRGKGVNRLVNGKYARNHGSHIDSLSCESIQGLGERTATTPDHANLIDDDGTTGARWDEKDIVCRYPPEPIDPTQDERSR